MTLIPYETFVAECNSNGHIGPNHLRITAHSVHTAQDFLRQHGWMVSEFSPYDVCPPCIIRLNQSLPLEAGLQGGPGVAA